MTRSEVGITLLAALVAATLGARENLRSAPPLIASARPFYAMNVRPPVTPDVLRKPGRTKG